VAYCSTAARSASSVRDAEPPNTCVNIRFDRAALAIMLHLTLTGEIVILRSSARRNDDENDAAHHDPFATDGPLSY